MYCTSFINALQILLFMYYAYIYLCITPTFNVLDLLYLCITHAFTEALNILSLMYYMYIYSCITPIFIYALRLLLFMYYTIF